MPAPNPDRIWFHEHALERLREHYPNVGVRGAKAILSKAVEIDKRMAAILMARGTPDSKMMQRSTYLLTEERSGLIVLEGRDVREGFDMRCVTYIRLDPPMQDEADRLYPRETAAEPTELVGRPS